MACSSDHHHSCMATAQLGQRDAVLARPEGCVACLTEPTTVSFPTSISLSLLLLSPGSSAAAKSYLRRMCQTTFDLSLRTCSSFLEATTPTASTTGATPQQHSLHP